MNTGLGVAARLHSAERRQMRTIVRVLESKVLIVFAVSGITVLYPVETNVALLYWMTRFAAERRVRLC
jgi:hypothetical protein